MARLSSLALAELSDRELLLLIVDLRDENGVVTTQQIAEKLDLSTARPKNSVGIRLAWMRRYGVVAYAPEGPGWVLTDVGERVAGGQLKNGQVSTIGGLLPEQGLDAAIELGRMYRRIGVSEAHMLRRGWQYGSGRRS
jgi:hypothetical protein